MYVSTDFADGVASHPALPLQSADDLPHFPLHKKWQRHHREPGRLTTLQTHIQKTVTNNSSLNSNSETLVHSHASCLKVKQDSVRQSAACCCVNNGKFIVHAPPND